MRIRSLMVVPGVVAAVAGVAVALSPSALADTALFPDTMKYKHCSASVQARDFNQFDKHQGYASAIVLEDSLSGPKGCSMEVDEDYSYWNTKTKKNGTSVVFSTYSKTFGQDIYGYGGPPHSDGVRLRKGSIAIVCRDDFDDCHTFTSKLVE